MTFRVYEVGTDKDVTDEREWCIDTDGYLRFLHYANYERRLCIADYGYYYKLEIMGGDPS